MFSVEHYIHSIQAGLEEKSTLLEENLRKVFSHDFSLEVQLLDFNLFIEPTQFELSVMMYSMDRDGNEVFLDEGQGGFAGSEAVFPDTIYYKVEDEKLEDFLTFYEENEEEIVQEEQHVFLHWFKGCWQESGGQSIQLPSYVEFHDDGQSFNLTDDRWIDSEDKWS